MARECDVVVLGMGPGGEEVAGRLAEAGLDVVGVEAELLGGECPYWACVPSKMMVRAGDLLAEARRVPGMAGTARVEPDFTPVHARIRDEATADWDDAAAVERFTAKGGRFVRGRGRFTGQGRVEVDAAGGAETFAARVGVVLATGSAPAAPPVPGLDQVPYWTNREAVSAVEAPESLLVLGGGAVGVELAQSYARFGTRVTLVEASERVVSAEEPEAGDLLLEVLRREGLTVLTGARARAARYADGAFVLTLDGGEEVSAEKLLVATGRRPRLDALDRAALGLDAEARRVAVDAHLRAAPGVWALGDLVGEGAFTHVAMYQADVAVRAVLAAAGRGEAGPGADYRAVPHVTFTDPEIGSVGLTEAAARERGLTVRTGTARVPDGIRGWIHKAGNDGLVKLVEDAERGVLVGATAAGPMGGEVLYGLAVAVRAAVPTATLRDMMFAFPTFHRTVLEALGDLTAD
ncbi:pyridine nucleotide-disulfide oxidoreductase [Streptomyces qinglanensis]|uniref:Pyridine nucleotide-disulfide oxidoreductase n=1 Tax=Streptomyces qinglanensis TaxID=943816 RepID=A0A1E7KD19_9ACTN|nr:NAD(P)/FAD-dependent oxidoreductase [Streptomyces qinglanensis]OEV01800.1 pyridine nucleotide-disulfide oxidoreductase [Streptomyces qinglanensis]